MNYVHMQALVHAGRSTLTELQLVKYLTIATRQCTGGSHRNTVNLYTISAISIRHLVKIIKVRPCQNNHVKVRPCQNNKKVNT